MFCRIEKMLYSIDMIRTQIILDIRSAIEAVQQQEEWSDFSFPDIEVNLVEKTETFAYQTNIAMKIAPLVKRHALEVAADIKSHIPKTYKNIEIVKHGILEFELSNDQMEKAVQAIVENASSYGSVSTQVRTTKRVLIETFSTVPSHPLNIVDARAAYVSDVLGRIYTDLGYTVTQSVLLYDREEAIERLGESVARRYLQRMGINVPYDESLIQSEYVYELAKHIELQEMTLTNIQKIEWLKKHIARSATEIVRTQMDELLQKKMGISINEWKTSHQLLEEISQDQVRDHLQEHLYERGNSIYLRTAQFGDVRDRALVDRLENKTAHYIEVIVQYYRTVKKKYDAIILSLPSTQQERAWFARQLPKLFPNNTPVSTIVSGSIVMLADGEPVRMKHTTIHDIFISDMIDTYGAGIIRWAMLTTDHTQDLPFDVQTTSKKIGDQLKYIRHQKKAIKTHLRLADGIAQTHESFEKSFLHSTELHMLYLLLFFPELLENITKTNTITQLYSYLFQLQEGIDAWKKECPVIEDDRVVVYRYFLLQAAVIVINRILFLSGMRDTKQI